MIKGIQTKYGVIEGRDGIFLDSVSYLSETEIVLKGEFSTADGDKIFEIKFSGIVYLNAIELDFDEMNCMESFAWIDDSPLIRRFRELDHSRKLNDDHRHYYFRTYDTVFKIVASIYTLILE